MKHLLLSCLLIAATPLVRAAVISPPAQPGASAAGHSSNPQFSAGGQHLVFVSAANNLVTNDNLGLWLDVFVHDLVTSNTVLVSVSTNGTGGANWDANYPSISSNGQFVAFASLASNLVPGDTNDRWDIFVRDLASGTTRLVSSPSTTDHQHPIISADGRWVFFESGGTNVFPVVPGPVINVVGYDLLLNSLSLVSADTNGLPVNGRCELVSVSADGRRVAFLASNPELTGENPGARSLFVRDMQTGVTTWEGYVPGVTEPVVAAQLSEDGTRAVFITAGVSNAVVRRELGVGSVVLGLFATNGVLSINADATRVAYESDGYARLWVYDSGGASYPFPIFQTNRTANPVLSRDGQALVFLEATSPAASQWQIHRWTSPTNFTPVSLTPTGSLSSGDFLFSTLAVNGDGSRVAFHALANDLVAEDRNGASDIFIRDMIADATALISQAAPARPPATTFAHSFLGPNSVSADGRFIASTRLDDASIPLDTNGWGDVFVFDTVSSGAAAVSVSSVVAGNTNAYTAPILSADGSTVVAVIGSFNGTSAGIAMARAVDGTFTNTGMILTARGNFLPYADTPSLSAAGRLLVFRARGTDFNVQVSGLNGATPHIWAQYHRQDTNGLWHRTNLIISSAAPFVAAYWDSTEPRQSPDGAWIAFATRAGNFLPPGAGGIGNGIYPTFQLVAAHIGTNRADTNYLIEFPRRLISRELSSAYDVTNAAFSGNSRFVFFQTSENKIYRHDLQSEASNILVCVNCRNPAPSHDGSVVVFEQARPGGPGFELAEKNLVTGDSVVLPFDAVTHSLWPALSGDARYAIFQSTAGSLVAGDTNKTMDIFVRDRLLGVTMLVSANAQGRAGNGPSTRPVMAANGRTVVFQSHASDLVAGDYNDKRDLFVVTLGGVDSEPDGMDDDWEMAYFETLARDGTLDWDGDGATDLAEFLAGTDPKNSGSIFRVITVAPAGGGGRLLLWSGNPARSYRAEYKDGLAAPGWTALTGGITWNGTTASTLDTSAGSATNRFYRVLRLP